MRSKVIALLAVATATMVLSGCVVPPWEMRTYIGPQDPAQVYTDDTGSNTWQYNMSKVRGRWVCPACGYSCDVVPVDGSGAPSQPPPYCPEPWGNHGNERLVYQPVERCFLATTDRQVRGPNGELTYALLGKPFHPTTDATVAGRSRSVVHVAVAGLHENANVTADDGNGDFCRFLFVRPGAAFPAARARNMAAGSDGIGITDDGIHINPWRVTDGEVYHVQFWERTDWAGGIAQQTYTAIRVYSSLDGLVFFGWNEAAGEGGVGEVQVLTATGSVRLHIPEIAPPPPTGLPAEIRTVVENTTFVIDSNSVIVPGVGEDTTADPTDFTAIPAAWSDPVPTPDTSDWPMKRNFYRIPSDGRIADWVNVVEGTGNPVQQPYEVPLGAVGKGWVVSQWQARDASENGSGGYNGVIDDPTDNELQDIGGTTWWWDEGCEWNYDWLVEGGGQATYEHLWGNCNAVANGEDLTDEHRPGGGGGFLDTDPPPFIACAFVSSRIQVPPTAATGRGYQWVRGAAAPVDVEVDQSEETGHAVVVVGEVNGAVVSGSYEPGTRTVTRTSDFRNRQTTMTRCPGCGSAIPEPAPGRCPCCDTGLGPEDRIDGYASVFVDIDVPPGQDVVNPRSALPDHVAIPDGCLEQGPHGGWYSPGDMRNTFWVAFDLPKYLPPSVPAGVNPAINNLEADQGYRGRLVLFHRPISQERTPEAPTAQGRQTNWRWNAQYRCWDPEGRIWMVPTNAWDYTTGEDTPVGSPTTKMDPVAAIPYAGNTVTARANFSGATVVDWANGTPFCSLKRVTPADVDCEEFGAFEVIVSVLRKLELGSKVAGLDLGRVAPGVNRWQPDTTVGTLPPAAPKPEPSEVSPASETAVLNEGNVGAATTIRGTNLNRAGVDPEGISRPAEAARAPVTVGTLRAETPAGVTVGDATPLQMPTQEVGGAEGYPAAAAMTAGWSVPGSYKPVPLGQPAGTHTGMALFFQDLDGDGALAFYDLPTGVLTNTSLAVFDPMLDLPLEPVTSFDLRVRVAETSLPDNDYYAADFWPTLAFGYDGGWLADKFQYVTGSNRAPAANVGDVTTPNGAPDPALANRAYNLQYSGAVLVPSPPGDPAYRQYVWRNAGGMLESARSLTTDTATGASNSAPNMLDARLLSNAWYALWHRTRPSGRGWENTLRYNVSTSGDYDAANEGFMFSGRHVAGLRSLVANNEIWLFWHTGPPGQEHIEYLANFDPANPTSGQELAVSNSFGSMPNRERLPVSLSRYTAGAWPTVVARKAALSPFVYTKDPCAWTSIDYHADPGDVETLASDLVLNVAFTGYTRHEQNADICWVKYRTASFGDPQADWGKKAFPRVSGRVEIPQTRTDPNDSATAIWAGEELKADARRTTFAAQHLDWVVHDFSDADNFGLAPDWAQQDPRIRVAVVQDVYDDGAPPTVSVYQVTWTHTDQRWNRARNAYLVEPAFELLSGPDVLAPRSYPGDGAVYRLVDPPTAPQPTPQPLMLEINIAAGRLRFSSPLLNTEATGDTSAVVHSGILANAVDVQVYADYTPMVWRVTRDAADDDCPWVYSTAWSSGSGPIYNHGYLAFFWRRSYGPGAPVRQPNSTEFLYKLWAPAVQVDRPPFAGGVDYWDGSNWVGLGANYSTYPDTGVIVNNAMEVNARPRGMRLRYTDNNGVVQTEGHAYVGWSQERRVPVETELSLGPFAVRPELYLASDGATPMPAIKFWVAWTSPRALLDLRDAGSGGGGIRQSADNYLATVIPDLNNAVAELLVTSIPTNGT